MLLNAGIVQMNILFGNKKGNFKKVEQLIEKLVSLQNSIDVVLLPELWSTGYALDRLDQLAKYEGKEEAEFLGNIARKHRVWIGGSVVASVRGCYVNRFLLINSNGDVSTEYDKVHLFRLMDEDKYFSRGREVKVSRLGDVHVGMTICYDIRFCELVRRIALLGAEILFVSAEWPISRISHWRALLVARAIENQMFILSSNACGWAGETLFGGHSMVVNPWGDILHEAGEKEEVFVVTIDTNEVSRVRKEIPVFEDRVPEVY